MKKILKIHAAKAVLPLLMIALMAGCASDQPPVPGGKGTPIHLGMTKDEVLKSLNHQPKSIQITPRGEVWHYDNVELALIPFNFGFRPEFKDFVFDNKGILVDFNIRQP